MNLTEILKNIFCNNSELHSELILANQEIERHKETESELKQRIRDYKIALSIILALAFIASWIVVEMVIHGS